MRVVRTCVSPRRSTSSRRRWSTRSLPCPPQWCRPVVVQTKTCSCRGMRSSLTAPLCCAPAGCGLLTTSGYPDCVIETPPSRVDLHMHPVVSDGEDPPERLAERCAAAGLAAVALPDHNSTAGVSRMTEACATHGISVVPACEISTRWQGREHHCLAYLVPLEPGPF